MKHVNENRQEKNSSRKKKRLKRKARMASEAELSFCIQGLAHKTYTFAQYYYCMASNTFRNPSV